MDEATVEEVSATRRLAVADATRWCRIVALALLAGCGAADFAASAPPATVAAAAVPRSAPDDDDLLGVIPEGAETVIEVDVAQLRTSAWSQRLVAVRDDERVARTAAQGFDEIVDVDRAVFAVSEAAVSAPGVVGAPDREAAAASPTTLTVVRGRFDTAQLGRAHDGWTATSWRGSRVWQQGDRALALLTARTLVLG
jgi:hypothetical protein